MAGKKKKPQSPDTQIANNRKAYYNYTILDEWEAGIELMGSEVKSLRKGKASIKESYAEVKDEEVWLINTDISIYPQAGARNHEPKRIRKLLLKKKEISKIMGKVKDTGVTLVPLSMYFNAKGFVKVKIGLAKGKKLYDKREVEKKRDSERQMQRALRE